MSNYTNLKNAIQSVIKANGNNEITGPILQAELLSMITTLGAGYQYIGVAQPSTNPGTPDARVMYLAYLPGTYVNFGGLVVTGFCVLKYDTVWTKEDIPISGGGADFLTEPDDLTLETVENTQVLKFANRSYNSQNPNGMGYKILRKGASFESQVTYTNTIYEIRYDFALSSDFSLPSNCILKFNGGRVYGANITGGKMPTAQAYTPEMFGAGLTADDTQAIQNALNICYKVRMNREYHVKTLPGISGWADANARGCYPNSCVIVPSNTDIEINGVVSLITDNLERYAMFSMFVYNGNPVRNVNIHGKGVLVGDVDTHTGTTGEWGMGITIGGDVDNIRVSGLEFRKMWGDGLVVRTNHDIFRRILIDGVYIHDCRRQGISITEGDGIFITNFRIENIAGTAPQSPIDIENESGEDYGLGVIVIRNGVIRNCANPLVCNATANLAKSIIVENVDTDDIIQAHANTIVFNCVGYKLEMDKNSVAIGCKFGGLALINSSTTMRSVVKDSIFEGLTGPGTNTEISDCDFRIHNYDSDGNYEAVRCLYYTKSTATDVFMSKCSIILDEFTILPHFLAMYGIQVRDTIMKLTSPRNFTGLFERCNIQFFRSVSNGYLNKNTTYKGCSITFDANVASQKLYDLAITGVGDINVFDCVIYSAMSNPRASINGTDNNNIHDYGTTYKKKDGSFSYPNAGTTAVRSALILVAEQKGFIYFDTELAKSVVWSGSAWVNMDGSALS